MEKKLDKKIEDLKKAGMINSDIMEDDSNRARRSQSTTRKIDAREQDKKRSRKVASRKTN